MGVGFFPSLQLVFDIELQVHLPLINSYAGVGGTQVNADNFFPMYLKIILVVPDLIKHHLLFKAMCHPQ